jgi:hypothetical protein
LWIYLLENGVDSHPYALVSLIAIIIALALSALVVALGPENSQAEFTLEEYQDEDFEINLKEMGPNGVGSKV